MVAAGLFAAGLFMGTFAASPPPHEPRRFGEYWVLAADFHVHGFLGDGALAPWLLRDEAARAGLDAFVLTNHNRVSTARAARRLSEGTPGPIVIVGDEVTARGFHLTAAGIEERVDWTRGAAAAIRAVHAQGGVAIAAHPGRDYWPGWDDEALALVDGYERAHPGMREPATAADFEAFGARATAAHPSIATIGSSDFHLGGAPGWCRTYVLARERSTAGVIDAVRAGRTVAADMDGRLYGNPTLVKMVGAAGGFVPAPELSPLQRLPAIMAVVGLGALIVF
jgi:hypothetical protein